MSLYNAVMLIKMAKDKKVLNSLKEIYIILKEDKRFNIKKYIRMQKGILKGEKIIKYEDNYILSTFFPPFPSKAFYTNLYAVPEKNNIFSQQVLARRSGPISMYLCLTKKCNNNCVYCSASNRVEGQELETKEWIKVINDLQEMNVSIIGLTGGEPLLRKDLIEIVEAIDNRSVSILFTSGRNLTYDKAKMLKKAGLFGIGISLDSYDPKKHNENRKSHQAYGYATKAIKIASKAGLYTMVQTVVAKNEVDEKKLFNLFKLSKDCGANEVKLLEPILSGNLLEDASKSDILYDVKTRKELIRIMHKANKKWRFPKITAFPYSESKEKFGCGAGTQHSYISECGDLYPCDFVPMSFGNIREMDIATLWKDMNKIIGIPKTRCFAQRVNKCVYEKAKGSLPLNFKESAKICYQNRSRAYPDYYNNIRRPKG